jgi:hypothetical protein
MAAISDFYNYTMPDLPGIDTGFLDQEIINAAIDFSTDTKSWTYDVPAIDVDANDPTYTLTPQSEARVVDLVEVRYNGLPLTPASQAQLDNLFKDWRTTARGQPQYYFANIDRTEIRLVQTPGSSLTGGLEVKIAQAPTRAATTIPDVFLERWVDALSHRTKARLMMMKKKPWSNAAEAQWHQAQYQEQAGIVDMEVGQDFSRARMRTTGYYR